MAILKYKNIRISSGYTIVENLAYITNLEKQIPKSDTFKVLDYMTSKASQNYTITYNVSPHIELAASQFEDARQLYWSQKKSKRLRGQATEKSEHLFTHLYIAFHRDDFIAPEEILRIFREWVEENGLDAFPIVASIHTDRPHLHIHASIGSYAVRGDKKLALSNTKVEVLKRSLNIITYRNGFSICENDRLQYTDKEYAAWVEQVKAEGKVKVYPARTLSQIIDDQKEVERRRKNPPKEQSIRQEIEEISRYNRKEEDWSDQKSEFYFDSRELPAFRESKQQYELKLWTENGRKRTTLELIFLLLGSLLWDTKEEMKIDPYRQPRLNINHEIQRMVDGIALVREFGIENETMLAEMIQETGGNISAIRRHMYYLNKELEKAENSMIKKEMDSYQNKLREHKKRYAKLMVVKDAYRCNNRAYIQDVYRTIPEEVHEQSVDRLIKAAKMQTKPVREWQYDRANYR